MIMTHITQCRINDMPHLCDSPLDHVAEVLIVDVVVLFPNRPLSPFFEFVLTVTVQEGHSERYGNPALKQTHILTRQSLDSTAMTLFSSLGCRPILPARSSSLRLRTQIVRISICYIKIKITKRNRGQSFNIYSDRYLHRVPGKLVHNDGVLGLVKSSGDMLDEETKCLLVFLSRH